MLDNAVRPGQGPFERAGVEAAHGLQQGCLAGLAPLRQQRLLAAIAPELGQFLANAKNNIDRRLWLLSPIIRFAKIPHSKIHSDFFPSMLGVARRRDGQQQLPR
jgi:hypothetical protein